MIILSEVATKLEELLNGSGNPTDLYFEVETEGFHIDHIKKDDNNGNFIPVFISSMGGQFNPVKGLKQGTYSLPIVFYFPVSFKEDFFVLGDFLVDTFVGASINYGTISGKAISNISVPIFGEIESLDFDQFKNWVDAKYTKPINKREAYMSMQVTLYLSNAASGLLYGNDIKTNFSFTYNGSTYTLEDIDIDGASLQSNTQAQSEQEEDADVPETTSVPFGTTYGQSFKVYPNVNTLAKNETNKYFYRELLKAWLSGKIQEVDCSLTFQIGEASLGLTYTRSCFIQSIVAPIEKGQLFALTLTFTKKTNLEVVSNA